MNLTLFEVARVPGHPARYTPVILSVMDRLLPRDGIVLDPFAGTGRIHRLGHGGRRTVGVELEPEWANLHPDTIVGSALNLPFRDDSFDAVATSPCYGNRMADTWSAAHKYEHRTYTGDLGRALHGENAGQLQWGPAYKEFHEKAWAEATRVLKPTGVFLLNIKDHIRDGAMRPVTVWHIITLMKMGLWPHEMLPVKTPGLTRGANWNLRAPCEWVVKFSWEAPC